MKHVAIRPALCAILAGSASSAFAADVTWTNGTANSLWDTTSANWSAGLWNNAQGDGAIFDVGGAGTIGVIAPIFVNSFNFLSNGYVLNGPGSLTIASGTSTQTTGVINVAAGVTAGIDVGLSSAFGLQKIGTGTLELNGPLTFNGFGVPLTQNGLLRADLLVGGATGPIPSGTLRIGNAGVLPTSTRASIANGYLDIGANNVTLGELTFVNQTFSAPFNPLINAAGNGVIGTGTLRVTGEINVIGVTGGNQGSNTIATNVDLGGGTQVVRTGVISSFGLSGALQFTGSLSNGSLFKSVGVGVSGVPGSVDGMGLFGNNTYTGSTILNSGTTVITGTNATSLVRIAGQGGPGGSAVVLQGANGSLQSASMLQAFSGGTIVLDNNAALGASGNNQPNVPAATNNDRIRDDAVVQLRDGSFTYRGRSAEASSETLGSLSLLGGNNTLSMLPFGTGGTAMLTIAGDLTLSNRATMLVSGSTIGAAGQVFINGAMPAPDATGILRRISGSSDFLTYNGTTGLTPFGGYAPDFNTPGANVALTAASTLSASTNINALKRTGTFTTTIDPGQTLTIDSGMVLNTSGTGTFSGGTIAFGSNPGVFFGGTNVINSDVTGTDGVINANSSTRFNGNLSGLSGTITNNNGTLTMGTDTFMGDLHLRNGQITIATSQTLAGQGAIRIGVPEADVDMFGLIPTLSISAAGADAIIGRDIIVDNGGQTAAGAEIASGFLPGLTPLSNSTGSQTLSGDVTILSPFRLQGGGGGGTGATTFTGDIMGTSVFHIVNGRVNFTGDVSNAGGFNIGRQGNTAQITFSGTASGSAPIVFSGGNNARLSYENGALPGGTLSIVTAGTTTPVTINPLEDSVINNVIALGGNAVAEVGAGITAEWAGPVTGEAPLSKTGAGTLILSNTNTHSGTVSVLGGRLAVNGSLQSSTVSVENGAELAGIGSITGDTLVNVGGMLTPGNSIGEMTVGSLSVSGGLGMELGLDKGRALSADLLHVNGLLSLNDATLDLSLLNAPASFPGATFLIVNNDGTDAVSGTFTQITGLSGEFTAIMHYAYAGADSLGRVGDGNDIAVTIIPSPAGALVLAMGLAPLARRRRVIR